MSKLSWPLERNHSKSWNSFMSCIYSNAIEVMKPGIVFYFIKTQEKKSCKTWVYEVFLGHECSLFTLYNCWFWIDELLTDWRCLAVLSPQTATISIINSYQLSPSYNEPMWDVWAHDSSCYLKTALHSINIQYVYCKNPRVKMSNMEVFMVLAPIAVIQNSSMHIFWVENPYRCYIQNVAISMLQHRYTLSMLQQRYVTVDDASINDDI